MWHEWSTLKKLIWLHILQGVSAIIKTVTGTAPLVLTNAVNKSIKSLTQYGKCVQNGTPTPSAPVDIVCNNGALRFGALGVNLLNPVGIVIGQNYTPEGNQNSSQNNWRTGLIPIEGGKTYAFWGRRKSDNAMSAFNRINWFDADGNNISPRPSYTINTVTVGAAPSNAAFVGLSCSCYNSSAAITQETFDEFNWMLAETDAEIPYEPFVGGIYADGTPEVLSVAAASDQRLPQGYTPLEYVENTGTGYIDTGIIMNTADLDVEIDFQSSGDTSGQPKMAWGYMGNSSSLPRWGIGTYQNAWLGSPNTTAPRSTADNDRHTIVGRVYQTASNYYFNGTIDGTLLYSSTSLDNASLFLGNTLSVYLFARNNNGTVGNNFVGKIYGFKVTKADVVIHDLIPCKNDGGVIGFFDIKTHTFMGAIGTLTGEVKYTTIGTASAVNLFQVGDYADAQDIISGAITHKVGIKVLNGTETGWNQATTSTGVLRFYLPFDGAATPTGAREQVASTHFTYAAEGQDLGIVFLSAQTRVYFIPADQTMTGTTWKAWLAEQYAAGTPVIVVYPLAESTTESTTAQPLYTYTGDNTVSVTSNVDPVQLEVQYSATA